MRTMSAPVKCAPNGLSDVTVALSSCLSVSGSSWIRSSGTGPPSFSLYSGDCSSRYANCSSKLAASSASCTRQGRVSTSGSSILLVVDQLLGGRRHREPARGLLLLGQVREQARRPRQDRDRLHDRRGEAEVEQYRRHRHRDVHRQRLAPRFMGGFAV